MKPHSTAFDALERLYVNVRADYPFSVRDMEIVRDALSGLEEQLETLEGLLTENHRALARERGGGSPLHHTAYLELHMRTREALASFPASKRADDLQEQNEALREFYLAWRDVENGVIDFDLHAEAVSRLRAAEEGLRGFLTGGSNPARER